jgi:hypothetical protein
MLFPIHHGKHQYTSKKAFDPLMHLKMMSTTAMYPSDYCPNSSINRTSSVTSINIASGDLKIDSNASSARCCTVPSHGPAKEEACASGYHLAGRPVLA